MLGLKSNHVSKRGHRKLNTQRFLSLLPSILYLADIFLLWEFVVFLSSFCRWQSLRIDWLFSGERGKMYDAKEFQIMTLNNVETIIVSVNKYCCPGSDEMILSDRVKIDDMLYIRLHQGWSVVFHFIRGWNFLTPAFIKCGLHIEVLV